MGVGLDVDGKAPFNKVRCQDASYDHDEEGVFEEVGLLLGYRGYAAIR